MSQRILNLRDAMGTVTTVDHHSLVSAALVGVGARAGQSRPRGMEEPLATITAKADVGLVRAFLVKYYGADQDPRLEEPMHTVTTLDRFGTPYTEAMHLIERYRLLDYETAKEAQERLREWPRVGAYDVDPDYRGKGMQLEFTVEDPNVFTMPWSATVNYRRALRKEWEERICAENVEHYYTLTRYYSDPNAHIPTANKADF